jgi:amino acid adenylation domain-containing protein
MAPLTAAEARNAVQVSDDTSLVSGFLRSWREGPNRPALDVAGELLSFQDLGERAAGLASAIQQRTPAGGPPLTAVFAHRSTTAFAGVLGALVSGHGYVPLNRTFPVGRTRSMLQSAGCRSIVVDAQSEPQLDAVLDGLPDPMLILMPDRRNVDVLATRWPDHTVVGSNELGPHALLATQPVRPVGSDAIAYLLFTSGSTGAPKGVMVTHRNVMHFIHAMIARYGVSSDDRFSQMFDMTFDLSVLDMFVAWESGACVCCPSEKILLNPDSFIRDKALTIWTSVPSVAVFMKRFGALKPNRFESLRWSLFCGEPLPVDVATAWAGAAPTSTLENLYGPTELTVACSHYRWNAQSSAAESLQGLVPIGHPFPEMEAIVVDETLREVPPGATGELLMSGPQVTPGYWRNAEATARAYVSVPGRQGIFYRTGDRVRRPLGAAPMTYVGRSDQQVKILGFRVELGEIEARLREQPGIASAAALGWPVTPTGAGGIVVFVTGSALDPSAIRTSLMQGLPAYAVPQAIHVLPTLPTNANGKIDRHALSKLLES